MAGSFNHVVNKKTGALRKRPDLLGMLETSSHDVYEAVEEMYGMIWYLAEELRDALLDEDDEWTAERLVEEARVNYKNGLLQSPTKRFT